MGLHLAKPLDALKFDRPSIFVKPFFLGHPLSVRQPAHLAALEEAVVALRIKHSPVEAAHYGVLRDEAERMKLETQRSGKEFG